MVEGPNSAKISLGKWERWYGLFNNIFINFLKLSNWHIYFYLLLLILINIFF